MGKTEDASDDDGWLAAAMRDPSLPSAVLVDISRGFWESSPARTDGGWEEPPRWGSRRRRSGRTPPEKSSVKGRAISPMTPLSVTTSSSPSSGGGDEMHISVRKRKISSSDGGGGGADTTILEEEARSCSKVAVPCGGSAPLDGCNRRPSKKSKKKDLDRMRKEALQLRKRNEDLKALAKSMSHHPSSSSSKQIIVVPSQVPAMSQAPLSVQFPSQSFSNAMAITPAQEDLNWQPISHHPSPSSSQQTHLVPSQVPATSSLVLPITCASQSTKDATTKTAVLDLDLNFPPAEDADPSLSEETIPLYGLS
ncbi:hypothetical protein QJS10_CPB19g00641 [Acorus calamus]|uniref:Uncharacterized protein n=1 Tax=Acorus calamus TaxID=4465 RepID=A0AAV9CJ39_ACOCL|nr:hypothetical protein QJS10_CPB19g00641 [Acorus calamus]